MPTKLVLHNQLGNVVIREGKPLNFRMSKQGEDFCVCEPGKLYSLNSVDLIGVDYDAADAIDYKNRMAFFAKNGNRYTINQSTSKDICLPCVDVLWGFDELVFSETKSDWGVDTHYYESLFSIYAEHGIPNVGGPIVLFLMPDGIVRCENLPLNMKNELYQPVE